MAEKKNKNEVVLRETIMPTAANIEQLSHLPASERIAALQSITSYIGAESTSVDKWLNKSMPVCGVVVHDATVSKETVDKETGEMGTTYIDAKRVVFKLKGHEAVSLVSMAATSFVETFLLPVFGIGDWRDENGEQIIVNIEPRKVSKGTNNTYNFQVK